MSLQLILYLQATPYEYHKAGKNFSFPSLRTCPHPDCRIPLPPRPYGFYSRNIISISFTGRIFIKRYYCPKCGHTFSYLPSFCLPYYQYSLCLIWASLLCQYFNLIPFLQAIMASVNWERQHLQFYKRRFECNLVFIQVVLRQLKSEVNLPGNVSTKEKVIKLLDIVLSGFATIQAFSTRFFAQCNRSFMTTQG